MGKFVVYKSSAGSGKTFTLVKEYLVMVLVKPSLVRNVLAITFTNKAANEMKQRIISSLKEIIDCKQFQDTNTVKFLLPVIINETGLSEEKIQANSCQVLEYILHHYSDFGVSTIDSFVHKIIRSFAFDLHLPLNFEIELQTDELLMKVIDILLNKVGSDKNLTNLLVDFVQTRADEDKSWAIERDLFNVARSLTKEDSQAHIEKLQHLELPDFVKINKELIKKVRSFENSLKEFGNEATQIIESLGVPAEMYFQGNRGIVAYFKRFEESDFEKIHPNSYTLKTFTEDKWFSGKADLNDQVDIESIKPVLQEIYNKVISLIDSQYENYCTYKEVIKNLYPVAILSTIEKLMTEYKAENNLVLISEFNKRIAEVVLAEPIPFVYERVGEKYQHFLIDEFQDTSVLQWQNLLPLIENSLADANKNLIVGDGKQAIYRWRNGEVEQFSFLPQVFNRSDDPDAIVRENALISNYDEKELKFNFRSKPEIIKFNNELFKFLKNYLFENLQIIYEGVEQQFPEKNNGGFVKIEFFDKGLKEETFAEFNLSRIKDIIQKVLSKGYLYEDIAILCRSNNQASEIAGELLKENIQVISSESLLINNSPEVRFLLAWCRLILNRNDRLAKTEIVKWLVDTQKIPGTLDAQLKSFNISFVSDRDKVKESFWSMLEDFGYEIKEANLKSLSVYEICEELTRIFKLNQKSDPYLQFFLDVILEQSVKPEFHIVELITLWEQKKNKYSIVVPEGINAVNVMTIHKSKGLEFPVVIYPFAKENQRTHGEQLWVDFVDDKFVDFKSTLITTSNNIVETRFKDVYETEKNKSLLDLINILYVVLTRASDQLYIVAGEPPTSKSASISVPFLLQQFLINEDLWQSDKNVYEFGELFLKSQNSEKQSKAYTLDSFISNGWRNRILLSLQAPVFWETEDPVAKQETGKLIHEIFSEIISIENTDEVLDRYFVQGILTSDEKTTLKGKIDLMFKDAKINKLFQPNKLVKTEAEIILPNGNIYRPDRINIHHDITEVIDFKTGKESESHKKQVKIYMNTLEEMGYSNVIGYLLYVDNSKVVEVI